MFGLHPAPEEPASRCQKAPPLPALLSGKSDPSVQDVSQKIKSPDTLAAILPTLAGPDSVEQLARLLTDDDINTLRHLASEDMGENSLRALTSDFPHLEG
jgi:hypothetical protein